MVKFPLNQAGKCSLNVSNGLIYKSFKANLTAEEERKIEHHIIYPRYGRYFCTGNVYTLKWEKFCWELC